MISPWFTCRTCHAGSSDPRDQPRCFNCGKGAMVEMRPMEVTPELRVQPKYASFVNPMKPERLAVWTSATIYAARNPHTCESEDCTCPWVLWPEGHADDWIVVGEESFERLASVKGPVFYVDP